MPSGSDLILVIVVVTALAFDFTNGFHDTANAIATSVSTRAMSPRFAVLLSAVLNFAGAFISLKVAAAGASAVLGDGVVEKVLVPGVVAPVLAFLVAGAAILAAYRIVGRVRPGLVNRGYRLGQLVS